jgi:hypothetical protein
MAIYLGASLPAPSLRLGSFGRGARPLFSLLAKRRSSDRDLLLPVGFTRAHVAVRPRELLPHDFTLDRSAAGLFLWHFPSSRLDRTLSCTAPWEARTFLMRPAHATIPRTPCRATVSHASWGLQGFGHLSQWKRASSEKYWSVHGYIIIERCPSLPYVAVHPSLQMEVALAQSNFALQPASIGGPYSAGNAWSQSGYSPEPLTTSQGSPSSPDTFRLDGDGQRSPLIRNPDVMRESVFSMAPPRVAGGSAAGSQVAKTHQHHVAAALSKKMNTTQERQQLEKLAEKERKEKEPHDIHKRKDGGKAAEIGEDTATVATGVVVTAGTVIVVASALAKDHKGGREPEPSPPESRPHPVYRSRMGI